MPFPPSGPVVLQQGIPAYLYQQYNDDDNVRAFFDAFNAAAQGYLDWAATIDLPVYTGLSGSLLDWIAEGLYGLYRPYLSTRGSEATGVVDGAVVDGLVVDGGSYIVPATSTLADDDTFQRIMTWFLYRGDGKVFTIKWLKRRVLRWLLGIGGTAPNVADTSGISVSFSGDIVTISLTALTGVPTLTKQLFQEVMQSNLLELPPQFIFVVEI